GALRKGFEGAGIRLPAEGGRLLVSIAQKAREPGDAEIIRRFVELGYTIVATPGTHVALEAEGIASERVNKIAEGSPHVLDLIAARSVNLVINTVTGPREATDGYRIRRAAAEASVACITSLDTAAALASALAHPAGPPRSLQEYHRMAVAAR
ncbi:MAG: carbamoyl-phosphate synthase large subunit, partial [Candidatus Eremiobacteraeota bacterium]|nr:carbamoyl-phosphate synthase large subunit [Candidatus Eremiobacteraeota bacterium]